MKKVIGLFVMVALFVPYVTFAISGTNASDVDVNVYTKQGGEWIKVRATNTDSDGVLKLKDALPGKYRYEIDSDDVQTSQTLAAEVRVLDEDGRRIKDKTDVNVYVYISGTKIFAGTVESDDSGWIDLSGITSGTEYELEVDGDGKAKKKDGLPRIKAKAKVDGSDWFQAAYKRADPDPTGRTAGIFEIENVLPGKYKFKYKKDAGVDLTKPFTLKARLRDEDGDKIKKKKKVKVYMYAFGMKKVIAEIKTDKKGWITLPGVQAGVKYKIKVK